MHTCASVCACVRACVRACVFEGAFGSCVVVVHQTPEVDRMLQVIRSSSISVCCAQEFGGERERVESGTKRQTNINEAEKEEKSRRSASLARIDEA